MSSRVVPRAARRVSTFSVAAVLGLFVLAGCAADETFVQSATGQVDEAEVAETPEAEAQPSADDGDGDGDGETADATEPAEAQPSGDDAEASGDEAEPERTEEVEEAVAEMEEVLEDAPAEEDELLDVVDPLDEEATNSEKRDARSEREDPEEVDGPRNETGERVELDEAASLACGDIERALTAMDEGAAGDAAAAIASAATRAGESSVGSIADWSESLAAAADAEDPAVLLGFIASCTEGGYEL